jgi:redox-sensitive bicupin YhaK (pirin superfamily)
MSGPVTATDVVPAPDAAVPTVCDVEVIEGRATTVGGVAVRRVLPRRARRTVGPWCFVDQMGPSHVEAARGLDIGPHPHIGLQTVTWLMKGEVLHRDSLGSEQLIRPGQLNLMTAGAGVSHAEETAGIYDGELHGLQLWVAQPDRTRHTTPAFEHHDELPQTEIGAAVATLLIGDLDGLHAPARRDTDHLGIHLDLRTGRTTLPLDGTSEHALVVAEGRLQVGGTAVAAGQLGYLGIGRDEVTIAVTSPCEALLIGGTPFDEPLLMWWNYVARTRDEISAAHRQWLDADQRYGHVRSALSRVVTDPPPWDPTRSTRT